MTTEEMIAILEYNSGIGPTQSRPQSKLIAAKLRSQEARLAAAEDLVEHILTSESRNPELGLALAFRAAGKGE